MHRSALLLPLFLLALLFTSATAAAEDEASDVEWGPWWVLLPLDHPPGSAQIGKSYAPEKKSKRFKANGEGPDLEQKFRGKDGRDLTWRRARPAESAEPDFGALNFVQLVPDVYPAKQAAANLSVAYAYREIVSPRARKMPVYFGSDDSCRVWLNGKLVHEHDGARGLAPKGDRFVLDLSAGTNHLLAKVGNGGGAWSVQLQPQRQAHVDTPEVPQDAINKAIDRGIVYLLRTQHLDGSWGHDAKGYRNGQTGLSLYALMKSGVSAKHPAVRRGFAYLNLHPPRKTYSLACQLLALVSTKDDRDIAQVGEFASELEDWQGVGYAYPSGTEDLSCTQYGALGLWAAQKVGFEISPKVWPRLLRYTLNCHNDDGGFSYRPGSASTGSMTVAGLTVIEICRAGLGDAGLPNNLKTKAEDAKAAGLEWLAREFRPDKNPGAAGGGDERWKHYYLYGVERLAALLDTERIGQWDWYNEGAAFYIKTQGKDGNWGTAYGEGEPNTSFGLLFLSRGTAALTGVRLTSRHQRIYATDIEASDVLLRAAGDTPLDLWVTEVKNDLIKKHARDGDGGHGLYVAKAEYFADGMLVNTLKADAAKPWNGERFAMQYKFAARGNHTVRIQLTLAADPLLPDAAPVVLSSPELPVRVDELVEDWMFDYPDDSLANLVLETDHKQRSSSNRKGDPPGNAFDGLISTGWSSAATDAAPKLTLELRRAQRVDRILLSHRTSKELNRGEFDRATKVGVRIDGRKDQLVFEMDPNEELKTLITLPKVTRVSELEIEVLERLEGSKHKGCVGFAEVELRLGDEED